uniref:DUF4062 domain-containing protein n=1 Tax=Neorhizobium sp. EC2-8 TaxID=3129230 RepID=UPI003100D48F
MNKKLQVFVSSTFTDLVLERQAAVEAILKAGHIPAGMELFTAGDKSQMKTIERWIDESDVYMLILGGRYGSIEPTTGLSYTELEFDYARNQGKPFFSVVITEDALDKKIKAGGAAFIETNYGKELTLFRQKVLSQICSFFAEIKDIKLCVYESLSDLSTNPNLTGWVNGRDVPDTSILNAELEKLRTENQEFQAKISEFSRKRASQPENGFDEEILRILQRTAITIPKNLSGGKESKEIDLLTITRSNLDILVAGVTNRYNASDAEAFYYHNILPKLQTHGLADNERVPGVQYRRSFINKMGQRFSLPLRSGFWRWSGLIRRQPLQQPPKAIRVLREKVR